MCDCYECRHWFVNSTSLSSHFNSPLPEVKVSTVDKRQDLTPEAILEMQKLVNDFKEKKVSSNPKDLIGETKPSLTLFPGTALVKGCLVMKDGVSKYGLYNWRDKKVQLMVYLDAALRHIYAYVDGEDNAKDSGHSHIAHAMMGLAIILDAEASSQLIDDRPLGGQTARLLEENTRKNDDKDK